MKLSRPGFPISTRSELIFVHLRSCHWWYIYRIWLSNTREPRDAALSDQFNS